MKKLVLALVVLLSFSGISFAQANIKGITTNEDVLKVGPSDNVGPHGPADLPGFGLYSIGGGQIVAAKILYEHMRTGFNPATGVATISGDAHAKMGQWAFSRVISADKSRNEIYYGVWSGPAPDAKGRPSVGTAYAAYSVGDKVTRNLDAVKGNTFNYTTNGVGHGGDFYTGTLTASFNAAGTGGQVTGGIANAYNQITIDDAADIRIFQNIAQFHGVASGRAYEITGYFYGSQAQALAGVAKNFTDPNKDVAFGGVR